MVIPFEAAARSVVVVLVELVEVAVAPHRATIELQEEAVELAVVLVDAVPVGPQMPPAAHGPVVPLDHDVVVSGVAPVRRRPVQADKDVIGAPGVG
jgi:hypothetical protein